MGGASKQAWASIRRLFKAAVWLLGARVASMEIDWRRWRRAGLWIIVLFMLGTLAGALREHSDSVPVVALRALTETTFVLALFAWFGVGFLGLVRALKPLGRDT